MKDEEVYPVDKVVRLKRRMNEFALIKVCAFVKNGRNFQHYLAETKDRKGLYDIYHQEIELECLRVRK